MHKTKSSIKKETKDYSLSVSLLDAELAFTLKDYVNGLEYRRSYTEQYA